MTTAVIRPRNRQGLYSVFNNDSTVGLIRRTNQLLE